jgi:hypothetical protein
MAWKSAEKEMEKGASPILSAACDGDIQSQESGSCQATIPRMKRDSIVTRTQGPREQVDMDLKMIPSHLVFFSAFSERAGNNSDGVAQPVCRHFRSSPSNTSAVWILASWPTYTCRDLLMDPKASLLISSYFSLPLVRP